MYEPGMKSKNFLHVADAAAVYRRAVEDIVNEKEKETKFFCLNGIESAILELRQLRENLARKRHRRGLDGAKRKKNLGNRKLRLQRLPSN